MPLRTIQETARGLREKEFSSAELTRSYLDAIQKEDPGLHAYLEIYAKSAMAEAERADQMLRGRDNTPPLLGIPVALKDNILLQGRRATAGSKILQEYIASYDATAVAKLKGEGAVFLGKTNMDEFAMGSSTERSSFGPTKNPHDHSRVPGGSSGGSAAAVAAGLAMGALGSDTGGSIRQPASFCGVVGLKPSYGSVSRSGLIAMASSLDQIGPLATTVGDVRILFEAIRGQDPLDSTTVDKLISSKVDKSELGNLETYELKNVRVGVPQEYFGKGLDPQVEKVIRRAIAKCEGLGVSVEEITLPHSEYALAAYYIVMPAEVSANLSRFDGIRYGFRAPEAGNLLETYEKTRGQGFGAEAKRRIMLGTYVLSAGYYEAYYLKAQQVRRLIRDDFKTAFRSVDIIIGPTAPTPAFRFGEKTTDPLAMYLEDIYTVAVNLAGLPAISLPAGSVERDGKQLPVGCQLIGKWFGEEALLDFAAELEVTLNA